MEDQQTTAAEPQHFENIDFNSSPEDNKESSNNDDHDQVFSPYVFCSLVHDIQFILFHCALCSRSNLSPDYKHVFQTVFFG